MSISDATIAYMFMGVEIIAPPHVLRPRSETEILGRRAVEILGRSTTRAAPVVVDMCCGSGNLAVAVALQVPRAQIWACDLTEASMAATGSNIIRHGLQHRVFPRRGDLFHALDGEQLEGAVDLVICNPPYISSGRLDGASASLLIEEPREAFDGGPFGLSIHQRLVREAPAYLRPGGVLACEFGIGQEKQVSMLFSRSGAFEPVVLAVDAAGRPRVAEASRQRITAPVDGPSAS